MELRRKIFLVSVVGVLTWQAPVLAAEQVRIATSGDYGPGNMSGQLCDSSPGFVQTTIEGQRVCGFEIDLMTKVCEVRQLNCAWTLQAFGWNEESPNFPSILSHLFSASPSYDLVVAYLRGNQERLEKLAASGTYIEGYPILYAARALEGLNIPRNKSGFPLSGLAKGRIRIAASGLYLEELQRPELAYYTAQELSQVEIRPVETLPEQLQLLSSGEVDYVFGPNISALEFLAAGHTAFHRVPQMDQSIEAGSRVFASKSEKGQLLIEEVNRGLMDLYNSGEYQRVLEKYSIYDSWGKQNGPKAKD